MTLNETQIWRGMSKASPGLAIDNWQDQIEKIILVAGEVRRLHEAGVRPDEVARTVQNALHLPGFGVKNVTWCDVSDVLVRWWLWGKI